MVHVLTISLLFPVSIENEESLSKQKQENVRSLFQRGYEHRRIQGILNVRVWSVYNSRKKHLSNVNCLCAARPR